MASQSQKGRYLMSDSITAPKNTDEKETQIYNHNDIQITNLRAVIGSKTYAIANITSVDNEIVPPNGFLPIGMIIVGVIAMIIGVSSYTNNWSPDNNPAAVVIGLLVVASGWGIIKTSKPSYLVKITTAAGEARAFTSDDEKEINNIVEALNKAIIQKG